MDMNFELQDLTGKVVVITGATSGIGKETAKAMVQNGAKVILNSRSEESLRQIQNELGAKSVGYVAGDCSKPEVSKEIAAKALGLFGTIDIVIPNAGIGLYGSIFDWSDDEVNAMMLSLIHISEPTRPY